MILDTKNKIVSTFVKVGSGLRYKKITKPNPQRIQAMFAVLGVIESLELQFEHT